MSAAVVEAHGVTVKYGDFTAVENVTVAVDAGETLAIIGPNGSGKSTLVHALLGILAPSDGGVLLFGSAPDRVDAKRIGYVPQVKSLDRTFPAIVLELVVSGIRRAWPWRITMEEKARALDALRRSGVAHLADRPVPALSGGELQRVYLARCLVRKPDLVFLDEPAAGVDLAGEAEMYHVLEAYQQDHGATIVMVTHDWEGARTHADNALLLNRSVVAYGPASDIAQPQRLLELFGHTGHVHVTHGDHDDA